MPRAFGMVAVAALATVTMAAATGESPMPQVKALSRAETEALVKKDLSARLGVRVEDIKTAGAVDRTWPDDDLGCAARKGMKEPSPVEGFAFTLTHGDKSFEYHTDRHGRFRRCDGKKPLGPIKK